MKKSAKIMAATGVVAAGALGLYLASDKGAEARKKIVTQIEKYKTMASVELKKAGLTRVKEKLERHKQGLEADIAKIQSVIDKLDSRRPKKETTATKVM
ncbi:MAG: hypothetical protein C5B52_12515 [Bacteroidetes bacterium]|nr:MAG: hypothetical protein C5B52_12515 [Bacteroidota bacterium]